jgi:hypothetical protein
MDRQTYRSDRSGKEEERPRSGTVSQTPWSFKEFMAWDEYIQLSLAPFAGGGRVFDDVGNTTLDDWKYGGGLGLRLAWNLSTVVSFNLATTSEGNVFYMELGHPF